MCGEAEEELVLADVVLVELSAGWYREFGHGRSAATHATRPRSWSRRTRTGDPACSRSLAYLAVNPCCDCKMAMATAWATSSLRANRMPKVAFMVPIPRHRSRAPLPSLPVNRAKGSWCHRRLGNGPHSGTETSKLLPQLFARKCTLFISHVCVAGHVTGHIDFEPGAARLGLRNLEEGCPKQKLLHLGGTRVAANKLGAVKHMAMCL